jgi:hypothetical protein
LLELREVLCEHKFLGHGLVESCDVELGCPEVLALFFMVAEGELAE